MSRWFFSVIGSMTGRSPVKMVVFGGKNPIENGWELGVPGTTILGHLDIWGIEVLSMLYDCFCFNLCDDLRMWLSGFWSPRVRIYPKSIDTGIIITTIVISIVIGDYPSPNAPEQIPYNKHMGSPRVTIKLYYYVNKKQNQVLSNNEKWR